MQNYILTRFRDPLTRQWAKQLNLFSQIILTLLLFSFVSSTKAIGQAANLDQGQNGSATSRTSPVKWINGNLGPSGAHFAEGYSIPYRMSVSALVGTSSTVHHLIVEWDTKDQNGHALDYITYYDNLDNPTGSHQGTFGHAPETVTPTIGTAFSGSPTLFQIPAPSSTGSEKPNQPTNSFNALPGSTGNANATMIAIWGGTITALDYVHQDNQDATTASTKSSIDISFTAANGSSALLAWGGHIAAEYDWGTGRGATGVNGSPYHMRLISIDGKGGNQDRSLKASAVIIPKPPCTLSANQTACEGSVGPLAYSYTGSTSGVTNYAWSLTSNTAGAKIDGTASGASVTSVNIVPTGTGFITGSFTLQLITTNLGGTTTCTATGTITARPTRPTVTYKGPECNETTFSVTVVGAVTDGSYTLTQDAGGIGPVTKTTAADAVSGNITFSGLTVGKGFSITLTAGDCTSDATDCGNYKTAVTTGSASTNQPTVIAQQIELNTQPNVTAAPNPYSDKVRFSVKSAVSGQGTLDLYNMLGQKVRTVFQGHVEAGQVQNFEYNVPNAQRSNLLYIFRVGNHKVSGKLLH